MADRYSDNKTKQLVTTALMMSLILVCTIVIRIPIPMTQGYVHMGDAMIYLAVMVLGRKNGTIAAGVASAMADILGGFAMWAPWSLVCKGAMAFIAGTFMISGKDEKKFRKQAGMVLGGLVMTVGYYIAEWVMYGNAEVALLGIPWNVGQFVIGIILAKAAGAVLASSSRA